MLEVSVKHCTFLTGSAECLLNNRKLVNGVCGENKCYVLQRNHWRNL